MSRTTLQTKSNDHYNKLAEILFDVKDKLSNEEYLQLFNNLMESKKTTDFVFGLQRSPGSGFRSHMTGLVIQPTYRPQPLIATGHPIQRQLLLPSQLQRNWNSRQEQRPQPIRRQRRPVTCGLCHQPGHNRRTCVNRLNLNI